MFPATGSTMTAAISAPRLPQQPAHSVGVVELGEQGQLGQRPRDAGAVGHPERQRTRPRPYQEGVHVPVVAAGELDDGLAAGGGPREA